MRRGCVWLSSRTGWALADLLEMDGETFTDWIESARAMEPREGR